MSERGTTDALKRVPTGIYGPLKRVQDIRPTIVPAYRCPAYKLLDENVKDHNWTHTNHATNCKNSNWLHMGQDIFLVCKVAEETEVTKVPEGTEHFMILQSCRRDRGDGSTRNDRVFCGFAKLQKRQR